MTLTKQHYELLADILKECHQLGAWCFDNDEDFDSIVTHFENHIAPLNKLYDSAKFRLRCGVKE